MSNFQTFGAVTEGLEGSAPARFIASTIDSYANLLVAGYLNDKSKIVKANDIIDINYLDASVFPLNVGESSIFGAFKVQYDPSLGNWNLIPALPQSSIITSLGFHSATYSNAGGSATVVISDASINPNSIVQLRVKSSANAVAVEKVLPGNGQITVLLSGDPGVSVLEYISFLPSVALQNLGVYGAQYSYAGGSATLVIANANITAAMVAQANIVSSVSAVKVESVLAAAGSITIVFSADPGISVISYMAVLPSSGLTADGLYAAKYSNAGGSTTISITDANITASSIVVADFASQANASFIEKVTPSASTLTILVNADPGVSVVNYSATPSAEGAAAGTYLLAANNLSDVASASASLANLGGLPLAGGLLTGQAIFDKGTGTVSTGAVTVNHQAGVITAAVTTTATNTTAITFNNSLITSSSVILVSKMGGTNTTIPGVELSCVYSSPGVATLNVTNNNVAGTALNGNVLIGFVVL